MMIVNILEVLYMNTLKKLSGFVGVKGPVLTIVMDGIGLAPETASNAVAAGIA